MSLLWYTHYIFKLLCSSSSKSQILTDDLLPSQKNAWSRGTQHKTQFNTCMCSLLKQYISDYSLLYTQLLQGFWMMICGNLHIRFETWIFIAWCFNHFLFLLILCVWCCFHENDFQLTYVFTENKYNEGTCVLTKFSILCTYHSRVLKRLIYCNPFRSHKFPCLFLKYKCVYELKVIKWVVQSGRRW